MDVAEDMVLWARAGHGEEELLAAQVTVQIGVCRAVGDEEVDIGLDCDGCFQIWPCGDAVEFDAVELQSLVFQIYNSVGNQTPCSYWVLVEDTVVITRDEYPKLGRDGIVPGEEVLQVGWIKAFASISGTDEDVGVSWYRKTPIHPVGVGEGEDFMAFEYNFRH